MELCIYILILQIICFRIAYFKSLPVVFFLLACSFWFLKMIIPSMEGGLMGRMLAEIVSRPGKQDDFQKENARTISKSLKNARFAPYMTKLIIMHTVPLVYLGLVLYCMMGFSYLPFDNNALPNAVEMLIRAFTTEDENRTYKFAKRFPIETAHLLKIHGPSVTYQIKDIYCTQALASTYEITYCFVQCSLIILLYVMVIDKLQLLHYFIWFMWCGEPYSIKGKYLTPFNFVAIYQLQKNVSPALMAAIWI